MLNSSKLVLLFCSFIAFVEGCSVEKESENTSDQADNHSDEAAFGVDMGGAQTCYDLETTYTFTATSDYCPLDYGTSGYHLLDKQYNSVCKTFCNNGVNGQPCAPAKGPQEAYVTGTYVRFGKYNPFGDTTCDAQFKCTCVPVATSKPGPAPMPSIVNEIE